MLIKLLGGLQVISRSPRWPGSNTARSSGGWTAKEEDKNIFKKAFLIPWEWDRRQRGMYIKIHRNISKVFFLSPCYRAAISRNTGDCSSFPRLLLSSYNHSDHRSLNTFRDAYLKKSEVTSQTFESTAQQALPPGYEKQHHYARIRQTEFVRHL